jgi:type I restriction enzyme S subunit
MSWREVQLGDVIRLKRGYDLPASDRVPGEIAIVSSSGITGFHNVAKVAGPGVVTGRYGTLGEVHYIEGDYWPLNTALYVEDFKGNQPRYVAYLLMTLELGSRNAAGAVPGVNRNTLHQMTVRVPDEETQHRIVEVLSAYDDLIAINQRRIALLEDAARRLYREWFVHLRFPGHESVPVKDGVPEGWEKLPLGDIAEITMGQSPESKYYNADADGLPFHQGVSDFGDRFIKNETYTRQATRIAEAGDILCSVRAPVGRLNLTREKIAIGRGLSAMRSRTGHQSLLFYQLKALFVEEDMIGGGAIFASVGKKELFGQLILQPSTSIATTFNRLVSDLDLQIETLDSQNQKLAQARDLLLPKLMSGQLDVSRIRLPDEVAA